MIPRFFFFTINYLDDLAFSSLIMSQINSIHSKMGMKRKEKSRGSIMCLLVLRIQDMTTFCDARMQDSNYVLTSLTLQPEN